MYSHYGITPTTKIPLKNITSLLVDAFKRDTEAKLWQQWLVNYGRMNGDNFISFDDYKSRMFQPKTTIPKGQILADAEKIKIADQAERR